MQGPAESAIAAPGFGVGGLSLNRCDAPAGFAAEGEFL